MQIYTKLINYKYYYIIEGQIFSFIYEQELKSIRLTRRVSCSPGSINIPYGQSSAKLPDHSVIWSFGHSVTRSLGHLVTRASLHPFFNIRVERTHNIRGYRSAAQTNISNVFWPNFIVIVSSQQSQQHGL